MRVAVPSETYPGERRVAIVPAAVPPLTKAGLEVVVQAGAGEAAGFVDAAYEEQGAKTVASRADLFADADAILQVRGLGANPDAGRADLDLLRKGQLLAGFQEPLTSIDELKALAGKGVSVLALELIPRISRAQPMDALSSMATVSGYKAALLAAELLPKMFPMFMTAAGTIVPARVLVVGAGVAGLQAIATAKRLGAVVSAYDVRPAVKEQVESIGAKFVELPLEAEGTEGSGGYAQAMDEAFYRRQRELMTRVVAESDVVITTAAVPGQKAPVLVTKEMVAGMKPGSVIVDLAAERGGNCEATKPGETVVVDGVTVAGPLNLPSTVPQDASRMYANNISRLLLHVVKDGALALKEDDEIVSGALVVHRGEIVHPTVRDKVTGA